MILRRFRNRILRYVTGRLRVPRKVVLKNARDDWFKYVVEQKHSYYTSQTTVFKTLFFLTVLTELGLMRLHEFR